MINILSSSRYKVNKSLLKKFAQDQLDKHRVGKNSSLNIVFIGGRKMKQIANKHKRENLALPILTFSYINEPIETANSLIGEILICYPQAILLAAEREKRVDVLLNSLIEHGIQNIFIK